MTENADETILQVKIRRKDVYDAVRNILLNEFKIVPQDLMAAVERKIDSRITHVLDEIVRRQYGFGSKIATAMWNAIDAETKRVRDAVMTEAKDEIRKVVRGTVGDKLLERVMEGLFAEPA